MSSALTLTTALAQAGLAGRFAAYTPHFSITEFQPGTWWVLDGAVQVGLLTRTCDFAELTNYDPHHPRRDLSFPRYYHAPTHPGDRLTIAKWVNAQSTTSTENALTWEVQPAQVTAIFRERWANGRTGLTRLTWRVDADFGYVLHATAEMRSPVLESHEFCNFLPRGATDDRPGYARYPYLLWQHPTGRIVRWNHNNISARALGALDVHDRRRIHTGGFIGFFGEADRGTAIELLSASPGVASGTCPNMFDEHLAWVPTEVEAPPRAADGTYVSHAEYRLVSVPPAVDQALTAQAVMLDLVADRVDADLDAKHTWCAHEYPRRPGTPKSFAFPTMELGKVADFETVLDPASTFRGQVFRYLPDTDEPITVVSTGGHSGTRALRLRAAGDTVQASGYGNCFHVTAGRRYRLSAWVKTELTAGAFTLTAHEFLYSAANTTARHTTPPLSGVHTWQPVAVEFVPGEQAHVAAVELTLTGHGQAWVDDLLLQELPN